MSKQSHKKEHYNIPQLLFYAVFAKISVCIWGRATGKSTGPGALFSAKNVIDMPRSLGAFVNVSYEKMLTVLLPGIIKGWEKLGYQENVHYFVRKQPPAKWNWNRAYRPPQNYDNYIPWFNGSGIQLISLDRVGLFNGGDLDWLYADETRYLKKDRLDEVTLCLRGNAEHFGHLSNHHSILYTTDMPKGSESKWLLDYREQMDEETVELILSIQQRVIELEHELLKPRVKGGKKAIERQLEKFYNYLNDLRNDLVYFSTATTFDNIHALGLEPIKNFKRMLSDLDFQMSVLNKEINKVEDGFYGLFDEELHGYTASNYKHIEQLDLSYSSADMRDCRWDADLLQNEPIDIACDYNASINWVVCGQPYNKAYKIINSFYVKHPYRIKELVKEFCRYYQYKPLKEVNYYYDHTAIGDNAKGDLSFADEWVTQLEERGWAVNRIYIGQAPSHHSRYLLWQSSFGGDNPRLPLFRINTNRNTQLITSLQGTQVKQGRTGFEKDKTKERDKNFPQEDAPHGGEALDTLWYGTQRHKLGEQVAFPDVTY